MATKKHQLPTALPSDQIAAKLAALQERNQNAVKALSAHFGAERWARIVPQCENRGMDAEQIECLCGKMLATRQEWHPDNAALALQAAANGFLCAIGSAPSAADEAAYQAALKPL